MLVSIEWLRELLPSLADEAPEAIAARLTGLGLEVEGLKRLADQLRGVVVAKVTKVEPHPKADKLRLATVDAGGEPQTVVCGAPNVAEGQRVALAPLGVTLPNGMTMEPRKIRGVLSQGMLCAEDELGLSDDHDGILVLETEAAPGTPLAEAIGFEDVVLELGVTPNRPDALAHIGVARDLAAHAGRPLPGLEAAPSEAGPAAETLVKVGIEDEGACSRYAARVLSGVKVGPSPKWVQDRLRKLGQRPISNVVDATNLVLLELGQPLHAFDLDRLEGQEVRVRRARAGETIDLLDGSKKKLHDDDLVIADAARPVALAGVMGGADSEVTEATEQRVASTRIMLESARFEPSVVRRSSKRHGLHTEASHRFERGTDPAMVELAVDRCAELIAAWTGATVHAGRVLSGAPVEAGAPIPVRAERAEMLLGVPVDAETVMTRLSALGLTRAKAPAKVEDRYAHAQWFRAPSWRMDLGIEADLIEEVGRLGGFDAVPGAMPSGAGRPWTEAPPEDAEAKARALMVGEGFLETISLAFGSESRSGAFASDPSKVVRLANPLGEESRWMRPSLLPALLEAARHNQAQLPSITDLRLFEIGRSFEWGEGTELPEEEDRVAVLLRGRRAPRRWFGSGETADVYDLVGALEGLFDGFRAPLRLEAADIGYLHPRSASTVWCGDVRVGVLGELHPDQAEAFELEGPPVFVAELALNAIAEASSGQPQHVPLPRFPPAQRDLSLFVDDGVEARAALEVVREAGPDELERVEVFDVYQGKGVPEGKKSLALELVFRAPDRTLADKEIAAAQSAIVDALRARLGAELREG